MGIQYKNTKNSMKPKNYPKSKTLRVLNNKVDIDWLVAFYEAKCIVQWADEQKLSVDSIQAPTSTASTQISPVRLDELRTEVWGRVSRQNRK